MFRLHETMRRRVCRLAFVALCALPTLATAAWIVHWHRPWRVSDEELRLSSTLRSEVRLVDWREPRPAATQTSSLRIVISGAAEPLVEAVNVRSSCVGDAQVISIGRLSIDARRLNAVLERAADWLTDGTLGPVRLTVDELVFDDTAAGTRFALRRVELHAIRTGNETWKLQLIGRSGAGSDDARALRITCERDAADHVPVIRAAIDATEVHLPAWLLRSAAPVFGSVGNSALFAGLLEGIEVRDAEVSGSARGDIHNAALEAMLPATSPCRVEGTCPVTLGNLRWRHHQIEHLAGAMKADRIRVNRAVLNGATKYLWFGQVGIGPARAGEAMEAEMVVVDAVAIRFDFSRQGLSVGGDFPPEANLPVGCVAVKDGTPLLMQPQYLLPAGLWVQFVAGPAAATMPATQEAVNAARRLPLPEAGTTTK
jgi:hypothetical protein